VMDGYRRVRSQPQDEFCWPGAWRAPVFPVRRLVIGGSSAKKKGVCGEHIDARARTCVLVRRDSRTMERTYGTVRRPKEGQGTGNPPLDAGRRLKPGRSMSNSSFLGLLFYAILSLFAGGAWAVTVVAGGEHTCAILNDGSVKCWGRNHKGQLASGDYTDRSTPTPTDLLPRPVVKLALGHQHTCVVLDDGTARCWGDNFYGQLGNGEDGVADRVPQTPQGFGSTGSVTDIACGEEFTCASVPTARSCAGGEAAVVRSGMELFPV